jgi:hypothetical protein
VRSFVEHRQERERQIVECLERGIDRIPAMVPIMYAGLPAFLHLAAARSVLAHVLHMLERGIVHCESEQPALDARYRLTR